MAEKQIIPAVVGLSGGFVIAGGVIALMVGLGIITRFVGITHTAKHVKGYETAILAGAIFGNLLTVHQIRIPLGIFGLVLMGVLFGIFCWWMDPWHWQKLSIFFPSLPEGSALQKVTV